MFVALRGEKNDGHNFIGQAIEKGAKLGTPEQRRCLVVSSPGWHAGVVGIVASRLVEKFHRPALVLAEDGTTAKGSGRSVEGFHLYDALARCGRHLTRFGGHKHAAGMQLPTSGIGEFADAIESEARTKLDAAQLTPHGLREPARHLPRGKKGGAVLADTLQHHAAHH